MSIQPAGHGTELRRSVGDSSLRKSCTGKFLPRAPPQVSVQRSIHPQIKPQNVAKFFRRGRHCLSFASAHLSYLSQLVQLSDHRGVRNAISGHRWCLGAPINKTKACSRSYSRVVMTSCNKSTKIPYISLSQTSAIVACNLIFGASLRTTRAFSRDI